MSLKRAWAEIDLAALERNVNKIKKLLTNGTQLMPVVKADAYGHGEVAVCSKLEQLGIKYYGVSNLTEAIGVRGHCSGDILILGYTPAKYANEIYSNDIIQGIVSYDHAEQFNAQGKTVRCHIKIDTGMGRLGYDTENIADLLENTINMKNLSVEGIYTHYACADSLNPDDIAYTNRQTECILSVDDELKRRGIHLEHVHFLNSAGLCYNNNARSTLARVGIIMYGLSPNYPMPVPIQTEPVMSLKAAVSQVKTIYTGDSVSYGRTFKAEHEMKTAALTIGYADGYSRLLSSKGEVLVNGKRCKIIGRVCMDQLMIDATDTDIKENDTVTLIGKDSDDEITADYLASLYGTIGYEVVCGISKRVDRFY
jgi:alanine racemase